MLTLHLEAQTYHELRQQAKQLLHLQDNLVMPTPTAVATPTVIAVVKPTPEPTPEPLPVVKRSAGRPRKVYAQVPDVVEPVASPSQDATPAAAVALDVVRMALQAFATGQGDQTAGIVKVREVLATFTDAAGHPCQKISQIQPSDYAALMQKVAGA